MNTVIKTENIGKKYIIGHNRQDNYSTLRDTITHKTKEIWQRFRHPLSPNSEIFKTEEFWALKNINFEIKQGDRIGIIGKNGAGKSTLLKILSRITEPTTGKAFIRGRVSSLLEVGTGFHPELTGRENIYLNGAILGMTKKEIKSKFDEIVAFAEVERFLDTPVKRYSSGMYVRLAFAVAAHLEPEVLIIDEVLAVGDAQFQKKCIRKMRKVGEQGKTVLFVSHNMAVTENLCSKAMIITNGQNSDPGPPPEIITKYLERLSNSTNVPLADRKDRAGNGNVKFQDVRFSGTQNNTSSRYSIGDDIYIHARVKNLYAHKVKIALHLNIRNINDIGLISFDSELKNEFFEISGSSEKTFTCKIYSPSLNLGTYHINLGLWCNGYREDRIRSAAEFKIDSGVFDGRISTNPFPILAKSEWA